MGTMQHAVRPALPHGMSMTLPEVLATNHRWLFKFKLIKAKQNVQFSSAVANAFRSHSWPVAALLGSRAPIWSICTLA